MASRVERFRGALLGLAVCDALGTTLEFRPPGSFKPLTDMIGGGPFHLAPGQWTDDTSMALCLAESLIECGGFDPEDQMRRYLRWWREGYWSSTGVCFDIGGTTSAALANFESSGDPFSGSDHEHSAGNGCIMRLAPVPMYYAHDEAQAVRISGESSRTTHGSRICIDACRYMASILIGALNGEPKKQLFAPERWNYGLLALPIEQVQLGGFLVNSPPRIRGTGYVADCLEAALWAFALTDNFESGALKAVNLGDDADTTGAVYGQIAGAFYGESAIPQRWLDLLHRRDDIASLAERLAR